MRWEGRKQLHQPANTRMDKFQAPDQRAFLDVAKLSQLAYSKPDVVAAIWQAGKIHPAPLQGIPTEVVCRLAYPPKFFTSLVAGSQCYVMVYEQSPGVDALKLALVQQGRVLDFSGTSDLADATCHLILPQVPFTDMTGAKTGRVHARFHKQFKSMPTLINQSVLEHLRTGNSLLCKGHSLGSSLAMLAAAYYARSYC